MSIVTGQTDGKGGQGGDASGDASKTGNQNPPTDWRAGLPEDMRGEKSLESIKGKDWAEAGPTLVKGYINAQKLVGADKLVIPGKDATPEQIAEFRTKLGVPAKPEEYAITLPEGMTEDKLDKKLMDTWRGRLHAAGIPKTQAEAIIKDYLADNAAQMTESTKQAEKQQQDWELALKQKFGNNYDEQVNFAKHALAQLGDKSLAEMLDSTGFGSHPAVVEFFAKAGRAISDDKARGSGGGGVGKPNNAPAAQAALNAMNTDTAKQTALWDKNHPQHEAVVKERAELFKIAFPTEAAE